MTDRLVTAISRIGAELTAEQWADALWLAGHLPVAPDAPEPGRPGRTVEPPREPRPAPGPDPTGRDSEPTQGPTGRPTRAGATLHLPGDGGRGSLGPVLAVPSLPALADPLGVLRSLRSLRMRRPSHHRMVMDEQATAALIADSAVWSPVLRPKPVRRFNLAVVVDTSVSMAVWQRTVAEFQALLQQVGAFHDVSVWWVDGDDSAVPLRRGERRGEGVVHAAEEVNALGQRGIVLVLSDCVGAAWHVGAMSRLLEIWARQDPVAVIQVLPQRMWRRCGPVFAAVRLSGRQAGAANADLGVKTSEGVSADPDDGLVVPVLELDARWLEPWSRLVAGGAQPINTMAMFTRAPTRAVAPVELSGGDELTAMQRVYRYRNAASPVAFQLAAFLAAAPLSLPVMRLVQAAMLPASRPAHLAEFYLGGLIYRTDSGDPAGAEARYEFHEGVRELLLTRLRRSDTLRILHQVADHIGQHAGMSRDFRAVLAAESAAGPDSLGVPFARVLRQVLTALGGAYAAFAAGIQPPLQAADPTVEGLEIGRSSDHIDRGAETSTSVISSRQGESDPERGGDVSATSPSDQERPPAIFEGVPTRNPHFTGRESLLADLKARLSSAMTALVPQALHGLGGVGKTQLAVEFCHRYAPHYDLVLWIPAEQPALARTTLAQLAQKLGLPRFEDQSQAVAAVLQELRRGERYSRWILVFDNADRPEDLASLMPDIQGTGHILITSRNQRWNDLAKILEVDVFTRQESIELLERRSQGVSAQEADQLAEKLGDLPLALEQAAAWRAETGMPVAEYLRLLDERMEQLLDVTALGNYPTSVVATWRIAFERLTEESPASLQLLELCAFFGAEPISNQLLPMGRFATSLSAELRKTVADSLALGRAIRHLGRYALAKVDPPTSSLQVHRLVQAVLREQVTAEQARSYRQGVQELLAASNPGDPDNRDTWERHAKIAPHILDSGAVEGSSDDIRKLVLDQVRYFQQRGSFGDSAELGELAYQRWKTDRRLGPDHEDTLVCGRLLGISLRWLGQTELAREINEDTYERQTRIFGENHEHTLVTANSLGADLRLAGRFKTARELGERTYAAQLRVFSEEDINTLQAANNRAVDLRLQGLFRDATELDQRTLASRRRVRGESHPETLLSHMNLGCDHLYTGRYGEARLALDQAIEGYERTFGPDHVPLLLASRFLSAVQRRVGDYPASYERAVTNVERYRRRLGLDHVQTLTATMNLCNSMRALKQIEPAAERAREVLTQFRGSLGPDHPLTLACAANLAITLRLTGDLQEARRLDEHAVAAFTAQLGKEHPSSLSVGNNLANDLYLAGEHAAALRLSATTYERSREVRGEDNAYTLAAAANHVIDLRTAGQESQARVLEIDTWHRFRKLLGEHHADTIAAGSGIRIDAEIDPPPY
ncbi:FxSxx-COOH system tetratricopeptide repeat protein [Catellatospora citrea]|uniref:FxSxx-COOH system tetratricopeptide repeat protein n=1 Tax=Catellatospora citrea TaxID=53366 RepID=UPI0033E09FE8